MGHDPVHLVHKSLDYEKRRKASHTASIEGKDSGNMHQGSWGACHEKADPGDITLGPLFGHSLLDPLAFKLTFKYIMDDNGFQEFREVGDGEKQRCAEVLRRTSCLKIFTWPTKTLFSVPLDLQLRLRETYTITYGVLVKGLL